MKYFYIRREDNNFTDIIKDPIIKKTATSKIRWEKYMIIGFKENIEEGVISYFLLKFGDFVVNPKSLFADFTPIPNLDYTPKKL